MTEGVCPDASLRSALEALAARDRDLARAYAACGLPPHRAIEPGFSGLLRIIVGQQVSTASAAAILRRLADLPDAERPEGFLALSEAQLKAAGFSRRKVAYGRALAAAVAEGQLDVAALAAAEDDAVQAALTALPGIGRWTAEVYLLFALRRPDVWPAGDLAVVKALAAVKNLPSRPDEATARQIAAPWRPHRSAAARLLWHYYRHQGLET